MAWIQRDLQLPAWAAGIHPITRHILEALPEIGQTKVGLLHVFILHTSASLTLNENADPDVAHDLHRALDAIAPDDFPYAHTVEGPDDMPAHVKVSLTDSGLTIPVGAGRLRLGTWQGIFLCEHRHSPHRRHLVLTLHGE
ncbi:MAG: secondary thiamine-phosphate synthase enzyme YjbQ [Thermoguttaceae bacterium]